MSELYQTPPTNRGLNSQELSESLKVRVDYLTGVCKNVPSLEAAQAIIDMLCETFDDRVDFRPDERGKSGRYWDGHSVSAVRGLMFHWDRPTEDKPGALRVQASGSVLAAATHDACHDAFRYLAAAYGFEFTRLDSAIDDHAGLLNLAEIEAAARAYNFAGASRRKIVDSACRGEEPGVCVYIGSAHSDKQTRFYNKAVEQKVDGHWVRAETQFRGALAKAAGAGWLAIPSDRLSSEGARYLTALVTGAVTFCDRSSADPNIDRLPVLEWWRRFIAATVSGIRIAASKPVPLLERSMAWLESQVAPTAALIQDIIGDGFGVFMDTILSGGRARHGPRHRAMKDLAAAGNW